MFLRHFTEYHAFRRLQHLIVHVTNHCNFRCKHCFIDFSPKNDLPLSKYQELGRDVGPLFWLDIGGGEPFLRKDLVEIVTSFQAQVITIPTNGYFEDRIVTMADQIKSNSSGELTIAISVDGLKETHDRIRENGSWDRVWSTFERLKKMDGVRVKINTVLCKDNYPELLDLMEDVQKKGPDFHSIILLRGNPIDPTFGLPSILELKKIQLRMFEILAKYDYGQVSYKNRILKNYHRYLWNTSLATLEQRTQVIPCLAGSAHAVVMGNGDISSCEMLPPIGNVKSQSWRDLWTGVKMNLQRKSIENKECFCTHNCAMLDSILFGPKSLGSILGKVKLAA